MVILPTDQSRNHPGSCKHQNQIKPSPLGKPGNHKAEHKKEQKTSKSHELLLNQGDSAGLLLQMSSAIKNGFEHFLSIQLNRQLLQGEGNVPTGRKNRRRHLFHGDQGGRALPGFFTRSCSGIPGHDQSLQLLHSDRFCPVAGQLQTNIEACPTKLLGSESNSEAKLCSEYTQLVQRNEHKRRSCLKTT